MNWFAPQDDAIAMMRWGFVSAFIVGALTFDLFWGKRNADN